MGTDRYGYTGLHGGKVIIFVHHSDIDIGGTRLTVAAVGTLSLSESMLGGMGQHFSIVLLFIRGSLISHGLLYMLRGIVSCITAATAGRVRQ